MRLRRPQVGYSQLASMMPYSRLREIDGRPLLRDARFGAPQDEGGEWRRKLNPPPACPWRWSLPRLPLPPLQSARIAAASPARQEAEIVELLDHRRILQAQP